MSAIKQSIYGKTVLTGNDYFKDRRKLSNRLNNMERKFYSGDPSLYDHFVTNWENSKVERSKEDELQFNMTVIIFRYLFQFDLIELWNPMDKRKKSLLSRNSDFTAKDYLNDECKMSQLDDIEKLELFDLTDKDKGGISIYRMLLIGYGIAGKFIDSLDLNSLGYNHSEDQPVTDEAEKLFNGNYDELLLKCAEEYHKEKKAQRKQSKTTKKSDSKEPDKETEQVGSTYTVEDYLKGEIKPSDMETELIENFREHENVSGGKLGALTSELNKRNDD